MGAKDTIVKVVLFVFMGALFVLILTHAAGFSTAVTAVGGQVSNFSAGLSGSGWPGTSGTATAQGQGTAAAPAKKAA